jgi:predicted transcriptional regulator
MTRIVDIAQYIYGGTTNCLVQMPDSVSDQLQRSMDCESVLGCLYGLKRLDGECYRVLMEASDALTVDEIADEIDRERSTAYRSVQQLLSTGFVRKEQVNYDDGGYCHVYRPAEPSQVTHDMQQLLNNWYAKMGQLIDEFERQHEDTGRAVAES